MEPEYLLPPEDPSPTGPPPAGERQRRLLDPFRPRPASARKLAPLPWRTRMVFLAIGIPLAILGVAGLFLPILQGVLFLILAAALLSLASIRVERFLHGLFHHRWPRFWRRLERFQTRLRWRFRERRRRKAEQQGAS
jgi:hypothetical protein